MTKDGKDPKLNTGDVKRPPYPIDVSPENDSSAWMEYAAFVLTIAEVLRTVGAFAYCVGIWRNEASVPGSHTPKGHNAGCLRLWCP